MGGFVHILKTLILTLLLSWQTLGAYTYDTTLLQTHAKLAPRLLFLSQGVMFEAPNRFGICIVHEAGDEKAAQTIESTLIAYYPTGLNYHSMTITRSLYARARTECIAHELLFLLDAPDDKIARIIRFASQNKKLTMSYDPRHVDAGALLSVHVGRRVEPILNVAAAKRSGIAFGTSLLQIARVQNGVTDAGVMPFDYAKAESLPGSVSSD